MERTS